MHVLFHEYWPDNGICLLSQDNVQAAKLLLNNRFIINVFSLLQLPENNSILEPNPFP